MPLTPRAIYNDVKNNDLDKTSALAIIKTTSYYCPFDFKIKNLKIIAYFEI